MSLRSTVSDYHTQISGIRFVRDEVFIREQAIPAELEHDQHDLTCWHCVVYDGEKPVATGRLDVNQNGKIGRVAVLKSWRRRGAGSLVMRALEAKARQSNLAKLWFHSQVSAVPFYLALGYHTVGDEFIEADIPHLSMEKMLTTDQR